MKGEEVRALLSGQTVFCLASGPSLTEADVELVRGTGAPTIVTNTTFRMAPWATILVGFDVKWWQTYREEVAASFPGVRLTCSAHGRAVGAVSLVTLFKFRPFGNSGAAAISLAALAGASRAVMLGYDCQFTDGRSHWHGDHPPSLSNARSIGLWPQRFGYVARYAKEKGVPVFNASRATALQCFPRVTLEDELARLRQTEVA